MAWKPKPSKWGWRNFLTVEEKALLRRADDAKADWQALNADLAKIQNRAIQRAKYHAGALR